MKTELKIILEAVELIKKFPEDSECVKQQCSIIIRSAKEIKRRL